jgi:hypothetical protein
MAIVIRSLYGWWFLLAAIAGSMLAMASASVGGTIAHPQSAAVHGTTGSGSTFAAADNLAVAGSKRDATAVQRSGPDPGYTCFGPHASACKCHWTPLAASSLDVNRLLGKNAQAQPGTAARVPYARMRVTRLQNGSILCFRDRPHAHIVAVSLNGSDDTASDGDENPDDDDSQDDQSGDDDTESQILAWIPAAVLYLVAPESRATTSWSVPSFPPCLTLKRLRC